MPLDPLIANPAKLELPNPLADSNMFLQNALAMRQIDDGNRKRRRGAAVDNAFRTARKADGTMDEALLEQTLMDSGLGDELFDVRTKMADLNYKTKQGQHIDSQILGEGAKTEKTKMETSGEILKNKGLWAADVRNNLVGVTTPEEARDRFSAAAQQAVDLNVMTPEGASKWLSGTLGEMDNNVKAGTVAKFIDRHRLGAEKEAERVFTVLSGKDKNQIFASPKFGAGPSQSVASVTAPERKGVTVNMPGDVNAFDKAVQTKRGEQFIELENDARNARPVIEEIDRASRILDSGNVILGAGSETMLNVVRVAKALGMNVNDEKLVNTEELGRFFAGNTLAMQARFKQMGASLTPMSDSDRRLIEMTAAQGTNDPATIRRLLAIQRRMAKESIVQYNNLAERYRKNPATAPGQTALSTQPFDIPPDYVPTTTVTTRTGRVVPADAINKIRTNDTPARRAKFDDVFGEPGLADRILGKGGTSTQAAPFNR